jgi:RsiW-degrading membrane proteinase PrsW (M82 family)
MLVILALVIAPAGILFYYFWVRDRWEHEPPSMIWKLFGLGCLSIIPAVILDIIIFGLETTPETIADVFMFSFIAAGLIEETSKFWFVYFYTRRSRYFSEEYDGIMYAVAVGLGFAFAENILYVVSALMQDSSGLSIAILRAFTAVPAHALDGVILGYFIGRSHFEKSFARKVSLNLTGLLLAVAAEPCRMVHRRPDLDYYRPMGDSLSVHPFRSDRIEKKMDSAESIRRCPTHSIRITIEKVLRELRESNKPRR